MKFRIIKNSLELGVFGLDVFKFVLNKSYLVELSILLWKWELVYESLN